MKKFSVLAFALVLALSLGLLAGCGSKGEEVQAPDLQTYYDDFMASLGDNVPMMMEIPDEMVEGMYPGLSGYTFNQKVLQTAAISAVAFEMALVEVADEADVEGVKDIFQARIDGQIAGGAMYPATIAAWEEAQVVVKGNVVALIAAGEGQQAAEEAFEALF